MSLTIVAISDTHNQAEKMTVPDGDILIHAGDLTMGGTGKELAQAAKWLGSMQKRFKAVIAIPGNHDFGAQDDPVRTRQLFTNYGVRLLIDDYMLVDGIKFYGSPWQPWFYDWAFNFPRNDGGVMARQKWDQIPHDTNVLITHGPPYGLLDKTLGHSYDNRVGCPQLIRAILARPAIQAHIFGHIHESFGQHEEDGVWFINAAICDREQYAPVQPAQVFEIAN
jgi:Icc-related predicted phosphoesterase